MGCRFIFSFFLFASHSLLGQEVSVLEDTLFDTPLEKQAFENVNLENCDPLVFLLAHDPTIDSARYELVKHELMAYSARLKEKQKKRNSEVHYLSYVFHHIHRQYLRNYDYPELFTGIFNKGRYNCVSGAALYACVLNQLGYKAELFETRFHVFLKVHLNDSVQIMYETTDPLNGFVANKDEMERRIATYLQNEKNQLRNQHTLTPPFHTGPILNKITLKELAGLYYYNIAVNALNESDSINAIRALTKAQILYPQSERISQLLDYTKNESRPKIKISLN